MHGRWVLVVLAFLWCLAQGVPAGAAQAVPVARAGHLALDAVPQQPLPLRGDWGFAWHRFVDPSWDSLPTRAFAQVPANWNDLRADGKPEGEDGWGSYVLQVDCPVGRSLAVEALAERTASRLYINGTLVAQQGRVGETPEQTWSTVHNRVPITAAFACPLRITLHVTNFDHRAGGFVRPLVAGTPEALALRRESQIIDATALLAAYLLPGLVALIFYAARRRERVPLTFGLFCIAMAVYTDMIGQRLFLRPLPAQVDWWGYMRVEYLSWIAAMALWVLTLRGLFPQEIHRRVVQAVQATLAASALAVILLPPAVYSHLATPGLVVAIAVIAYFACAMVLALRRTRVDAGILLAGILAVLLSFGIDLLLIDAPRADTKFAPIGLAVFLLSPAVVIARRLSAALNAEERNRALEENARLREDVERMSRHDLKTPLNSILGATRLLRDDPALGREQLELVDVLQQAGVRMLDMVNLSLGLFRMETGRYELRPQAVDLREVVTRVLVDLHSYAEASTVTLHLRGSDRTPMRVRAEEPLCYSIVANLVKNAVEAAGAGGHVVMALEHGPPVTLTVHNPGEVPPEIADRFFEKYVTGRKSGGTGLGTYSARLMARAQQGELRMHTGPRGTTLTLTLPAHRGAAPAPRPAPGKEDVLARDLAALAPRDVLVVDDDEFTRLVTRRLLPTPPFRIETAANGLAATEAMQRRWPHIVLMDMEMPHRNGPDTVRWIRAQEAAAGRPRCLVVMLSGDDEEATPARALAAGADRFLLKPVGRERLLGTLLELVNDPGPAAVPQEAAAPPRGGLHEERLVVDPEWAEAFPAFLHGYREAAEAMARALANDDRDDLRFLAHRLAGGLSAMGLHWGSGQSRSLERDALHGAREQLEERIRALREHLGRVRIETA